MGQGCFIDCHSQSGLYLTLVLQKSLFVCLFVCVFLCLFVCSQYMVISWPLYQCDFICDDIENTYEDRAKYLFFTFQFFRDFLSKKLRESKKRVLNFFIGIFTPTFFSIFLMVFCVTPTFYFEPPREWH